MVQPERRPVVLVAEELAPSALEVLSADFEIRHVDGADRAALLPALADVDAVLIRSATTDRRRGAGRRADRLKVVARAGIGLDNVDVAGGHRARRHGRQRADRPTSSAPPSTPSRCCSPPPGNIPRRGRVAARGRVEAVEVHRRRGRRQDRRRGRARPDRRAGRPAAGRVRRHGCSPTTRTSSPARAAQLGVRLVVAGRAAAAERLHHHPPAEDAGDAGPDRRRASWRAAKPGVIGSSTPPAAGWSTRQALADALAVRAGRPAPASTCSPRSRAPTARCSGCPSVVVTPHLGASTVEAQDKAGHRGGPLGPARAAGRVRARRGQRAGRRRRRRGRPARAAAGREARPGVHRAGRRGGPEVHRRGARRDRRARRVACCSWPRSRACSPTSSRSRSRSSTRRCWPRSAASRSAWPATSESPDYRNLDHRPRRAGRRHATVTRVRHPDRQEQVREADRGRRVRRRPASSTGHLLFFRYTDRPGRRRRGRRARSARRA